MAILLGFVVPLMWVLTSQAPNGCGVEVEAPVINGELGPCTADFTVTDSEKNPLYSAKIQATIRYGFMSKRKSELQIGTNSNGKARIVGLPQKVKKPIEIKVTHGGNSKIVAHDPGVECQASFTVALGAE